MTFDHAQQTIRDHLRTIEDGLEQGEYKGTLKDWLESPELESFLQDPLHLGDVGFAWGYLQSCADAGGYLLRKLPDRFEIDLDDL